MADSISPDSISADLISHRMQRVMSSIGHFETWAMDPDLNAGLARPDISDFVFGNPHELASPEYVAALIEATRPTGPHHFAYTLNHPPATQAIAAGLRDRFGLAFDPEDVSLTSGNFAGLSVTLRLLVDPGDEVIFISPPWFFYEAMIVDIGATPVRVHSTPPVFDLPVETIAAALTPRTRAIIVNSPHNPSGRIYPAQSLAALADVLGQASQEHGRPIYLLSDEAYSRVVFDGRTVPTPLAHYPDSFLLYTYGKTLLAPGSRLGYIAMSPTMGGREDIRSALLAAQMMNGWAFPTAPLQYAVPTLESMSIDINVLQRRRDLLASTLLTQGYELIVPEGTFYVTVRAPIVDDMAFAQMLIEERIYVLPGTMFELPGWFRISVTANDEMVARAFPGFERAMKRVR